MPCEPITRLVWARDISHDAGGSAKGKKMLVDDIHDVQILLRTFSWLLGRLGNSDMCDDYAYGLNMFANMIANSVKDIEDKIRMGKA